MREERRKFPRLRLSLPISRLTGAGTEASAVGLYTRNISAGGMFFQAPADCAPQKGAELAFEIVVPPGEGYAAAESTLRGLGRVVRAKAGKRGDVAVAVKFDQPLAISPPA